MTDRTTLLPLLSPRLWQALCLELVPELCSLLIGDVTHHEEAVRTAGAEALSSAISEYRDQSPIVLGQLNELYHQKLYVSLPPPCPSYHSSEVATSHWLSGAV